MRKFQSSKKILEINKNRILTTTSDKDNSINENNQLNKNCFSEKMFFKKQTSIFSPQKKYESNHFRSAEKNEIKPIIENEDKEAEKIIEIEKLNENQIYIELEKQKIELLFNFYETFIYIYIKKDYSNILNGFDYFKKNKNSDTFKILDFTKEFNNENKNTNELFKYQMPKNDKKKIKCLPKFSEQEFSFFDNLKLYKEFYHQKIKDKPKCNEIKASFGFDYNIFISEDLKKQIVILDILILNMIGIIKSSLACKLLEILLFIEGEKNNYNIVIQKNIKKALSLNKCLYLGLIFNLIEKLQNFPNLNLEGNSKNINNFKNDLEIRKLIRLSLQVNNIVSLETDFQVNFKSDSGFDKRKTSILIFIKSIDKKFGVFSDLLVINQHIFDYIMHLKIQDPLIEVDQFAYRVFLEFRNFLFEYQDKNESSPQKKIFKSLADKQLIQLSSRFLANKFYFWKPNVSINFENELQNRKINSESNNTHSKRNIDLSSNNNIFNNISIKNKTQNNFYPINYFKDVLKFDTINEIKTYIIVDSDEANTIEVKLTCEDNDNDLLHLKNSKGAPFSIKKKNINFNINNNLLHNERNFDIRNSNNYKFKNSIMQKNVLNNQISKINHKRDFEYYKTNSNNDLPNIDKNQKVSNINFKVKNHLGSYNNHLEKPYNDKKNFVLNKKFNKNNNIFKIKSPKNYNIANTQKTPILKNFYHEESSKKNLFRNYKNLENNSKYKGFSNTQSNFFNNNNNVNLKIEKISNPNHFKDIQTFSQQKPNNYLNIIIPSNLNKIENNFIKFDFYEQNHLVKSESKNILNENNAKSKIDNLNLNLTLSNSFDSNDESYNLSYNLFYSKSNEPNPISNLDNQKKKSNFSSNINQNNTKINQTNSNNFNQKKSINSNKLNLGKKFR